MLSCVTWLCVTRLREFAFVYVSPITMLWASECSLHSNIAKLPGLYAQWNVKYRSSRNVLMPFSSGETSPSGRQMSGFMWLNILALEMDI